MHTRVFNAFNTMNTVQIEHLHEDAAEYILDDVERQCARYERLFSHTLEESGLALLNRTHGEPVRVDPELALLIGEALFYCAATDGLFDITMGPVVELWSQAARKGAPVPEGRLIAEALALVGWRGVHVDGSTVRMEEPRASVVLGGIAKGYIADALVALLKERGVGHGFVNLGGNVAVFGGKPDGAPWNVGIRVPRPSHDAPEDSFAIVQVADGSVVTSGIYERAFVDADGIFRHHILDPRTGVPAQTDLASATLVCGRSLDGDGYTTALIVMGLERALAFAEALPGCEAVFVTLDGRVAATSGIGTAVSFLLRP